MNVSILLATLLIFIFGCVAIFLSLRTDKLEKRVEAEKKDDKTRDDVTHIIVHELRAPLTAIKDSAKLLETSHDTMQQADKDRLLSLIHDQSDKLLMQIGTILDAAKMQDGKFRIHKAPGDLNTVIADTITIFKPQAEMKHVTLAFMPDKELPMVAFDQGYLSEVITNLVSNSLKYTNADGKITVSTASSGDKVTVTVIDTGIGVPKEKQKVLFAKFSQARDGDANTGSGLGLYIVKGIIEAHGGTIALTSEENKGTTITVSLPKE